jgi:hypothetical protein
MRMVGGAIFTLGGVIPLIWFIISRSNQLKDKNHTSSPTNILNESPASVVI